MDTSRGSTAGGGAGEYKHVNYVWLLVKRTAAMLNRKLCNQESKEDRQEVEEAEQIQCGRMMTWLICWAHEIK